MAKWEAHEVVETLRQTFNGCNSMKRDFGCERKAAKFMLISF